MANRRSAQKSRIKKLQHIHELDRHVQSLNDQVTETTPELTKLKKLHIELSRKNQQLREMYRQIVEAQEEGDTEALLQAADSVPESQESPSADEQPAASPGRGRQFAATSDPDTPMSDLPTASRLTAGRGTDDERLIERTSARDWRLLHPAARPPCQPATRPRADASAHQPSSGLLSGSQLEGAVPTGPRSVR